jgi:hypothetical protein
LLAAAFMAVAAWHIHFSRTGFHYMQSLAVMLFTLYFIVRGIEHRRVLDWVLAGFGIGASVEVYYAARLVPIVVVVYLAYRVWTRREFLRIQAAGLVALAFGGVVFLAPMAAVFARNPQDFTARTSGVLITNPENLQHTFTGYHVTSLPEVLALQAQRTLEAFNITGETSLQYGHPAPLFDFWTGGLLAMSAVAILLRFGSSRGVLLASWVWLALFIGSVLTVDPLPSPRVLLALPALVLGPALLLEHAWRGATYISGRIGTYLFSVPVLLVIVLALQANVHDYFDVQVVNRQPANRFTRLANYAQTIADRYQLYAIGTDDWSFTSEAPQFLVPHVEAVNVRNAPLALPLSVIPSTRGVAFLVENRAVDYAQRMADIVRWYGGGRQDFITDARDGSPIFTSYLVEHADLVAASPTATSD